MALTISNPRAIRLLRASVREQIAMHYITRHDQVEDKEQKLIRDLVSLAQAVGFSKKEYLRAAQTFPLKGRIDDYHRENGNFFDKLWDPVAQLVRQARR